MIDLYIQILKDKYNDYVANGWVDFLSLSFALQDVSDIVNSIVENNVEKISTFEFDEEI